jgi:DNA-binding XRE family transcriptional regulator
MTPKDHPEGLPAIKRRLMLLRLALGLKKSPMARKVGATPQAWGNWESRVTGHRLSLDEAFKVCRATGAKLDWIYRGEEDHMPTVLMDKIRQEAAKLDDSRGKPTSRRAS